MEKRSKIESYVGFAMRAGKCRCGMNSVASLKGAHVLLLCATASANTAKEAAKLAGKFRCKLVLCKGAALETLTHREGCKVAAVTDRSLARAILEHLDEQFTEDQAGEAVTNG